VPDQQTPRDELAIGELGRQRHPGAVADHPAVVQLVGRLHQQPLPRAPAPRRRAVDGPRVLVGAGCSTPVKGADRTYGPVQVSVRSEA
jgi:hypothetical protein